MKWLLILICFSSIEKELLLELFPQRLNFFVISKFIFSFKQTVLNPLINGSVWLVSIFNEYSQVIWKVNWVITLLQFVFLLLFLFFLFIVFYLVFFSWILNFTLLLLLISCIISLKLQSTEDVLEGKLYLWFHCCLIESIYFHFA